VAGSCAWFCVAVRQAGCHFGEMAAMDYTALRSATIVTADEVVVLKLSPERFIKIAEKNQDVWKRIANELASRLRERTKFHRNKNDIPILFIGSSSEGLSVAEAIKSACESILKKKIEVRLWSDGVFQTSKTVVEDLMRMAEGCDFSVLVLTPDDKTASRGKFKSAPRDNVIYELGLFTGALGRDRSLIVMPSVIDVKIPTDLLGVTTLRYEPAKTTRTLKKRLHAVAMQIAQRINELGSK
jgi:predicted nucleotide-binding protein